MKKAVFWLFVIIFVSISLSLLYSEVPRDYKEENSFATWYEIYSEGETLMKEGNWIDAIDDFYLVLAKQPKDKRNARTYGMNFIKEFTPNGHLGMAYFNVNDYENAKKYLETSYQQFPTDLVKEYLGKVKIELKKDIEADEYFNNGVKYFKKQEYESAVNEMQEVLKIRPDHNLAKNYIERAKLKMDILKDFKKGKTRK